MKLNRKTGRLRHVSDDKHQYATNIANAGLTVTRTKLHVLSVFHSAENARLSAAAVYKQLSKSNVAISLSTVYKVLNHFTQAGLLLTSSFENSGRFFELSRGQNSGAVVCPICSKHSDIPGVELNDSYKEQLATLGFNPDQYTFSITSLCLECRA